jgi:hypothetical protein
MCTQKLHTEMFVPSSSKLSLKLDEMLFIGLGVSRFLGRENDVELLEIVNV